MLPSGPFDFSFFNIFRTLLISLIVIGLSVSGLKHIFFSIFSFLAQFYFQILYLDYYIVHGPEHVLQYFQSQQLIP